MRDEIVLFGVLAKRFDRSWWPDYRRGLERRFKQDEVIVRVLDYATV